MPQPRDDAHQPIHCRIQTIVGDIWGRSTNEKTRHCWRVLFRDLPDCPGGQI